MLQFNKYKGKKFIISILLMVVFAQSFALHFHFADSDSDHSHQAHAHFLDDLHDKHVTTDHEDETRLDLLGSLAKKLNSFVFLLVIFLSLFSVTLSKSNYWRINRKHRPPHHLLFYRPPLRAPPF